MPEKRDYYSSYGQKLISLFAKLLFTQRSHSLIELSRMLNCSKQTVLRLVDDIRRSYGVEIEEFLEGKRRFYQIKRIRNGNMPLNMTESEINALCLCKTFAEHLVGKKMFEEASKAIEKSQAALPTEKLGALQHFDSFQSGSIDYTPHQETMRIIIDAMNELKVCKVIYKSILKDSTKQFYIKPLKIFSHKDSVYLHAHLAKAPGKAYKTPKFNPLLAIHRIQKIKVTKRSFEFPVNYHFEKVFKQNFGVIKEKTFEVEIEFKGYFVRYVAERIWSPGQSIQKKNGKTVLKFSASSKPELFSWILSFGKDAKVIRPEWLVKNVKDEIKKIGKRYNSLKCKTIRRNSNA
jgi:predicted DNA-binding transcriptional regulator YafY